MIDPDLVFALRSIRRTYKVGSELVHALNGVDLTIEDREFIAVIGTSGSGKSTLMHTLGFMDSPTEGQMAFEGRDVSAISRGERSRLRATRIGFVFQSFNLLPKLTVLDNVLLPLVYGRQRVANKKELGMSVLERVGMDHRASHRPSQLSGGERQRVAIARSLINQPRLILADEPTGNLDTKNRGRIMELFASLMDEGITLALVTHDDEVAAYAKRRIRMQDGQIVEDSAL
ncbi:ABC transporter ATP-binding protein [Coraliomargarita sp. SDUM461004]|uniref:ABC transporter ATP-binding protein n=1 Tax=Thalassobacterium sedimentorum TaxID=3041258 RepID=A0ABU1AFL6_9BACT|nr:ABC transporter ATP-binding protein [Coraliomargarita sp. SDUM461004]MDQ8193462.1 ABC transporter ATP-binding protein [Coraliomargarita sp. SDUM461004]